MDQKQYGGRQKMSKAGPGKKLADENSITVTTITTMMSAARTVDGMDGIMILDGPDTPAPDGWVKSTQDLNEGSGGAYLYLCLHPSFPGKITDLAIVNTGGDPSPSAPAGFTVVQDQSGRAVDMNRGAGGDYLWLSFLATPGDNVIKDVATVASTSSDPDSAPGFARVNGDVNQGAGGLYIYIEVLK